MDNLFIKATKHTPRIHFDSKKNLLEITGESYPENVTGFYSPVFAWIEQYLALPEDRNVTVNIELVYFNSSSSKLLLDFLDMLEESATSGKRITINWIYDEEDSLEFGEELMEDFESIQFNLIQKDY